MASALDFVKLFVGSRIQEENYEAVTGDDVSEDDYSNGVELFEVALISCGGDMTEAAREYDSNYSTMWNNFNTALDAVSSASDLATIRSELKTAWENDYPEDDYPNASKLKEIYVILFTAVSFCWLYQIYSRTEDEKTAEDKKEMCKKLMYDVCGKAAISPTISDSLDHNSSGANQHSHGSAIVQGNMSTDLLDGFTDGYDGF